MDEQSKETEEKKPMTTMILYGILAIVIIAVVVILVAKYAFNVDLINFDQISGFIGIRRLGVSPKDLGK